MTRGVFMQLATTPWRHQALSVPWSVGLAVFITGGLLHLAGDAVPWLGVAFATAFVAVAAGLAALFAHYAPVVGAYLVGVVVAAGSWLSWVTAAPGREFGAGPWTTTAVAILGVLALIGGILLPVMVRIIRVAEEEHTELLRKQTDEEEAAELDEDADPWERVIRSVSNGFRKVHLYEATTTDVGVRVVYDLSETQCTWRAVLGKRDLVEKSAAAWAEVTGVPVRHGSIRIEQGEAPHLVVMHVFSDDVLAQKIPLPEDHERTTILNPLPLGRYEDGSLVEFVFTYIHGLLAGTTDGGKSNILNVMLAYFTRCNDVLVWVSAVNKAMPLVYSWLHPWVFGRTEHPVLDWVATTRDESIKMLKAMYNTIVERSERPRDGASLFAPTPENPAVIGILEESPGLLQDPTKFKLADGKKLTASEMMLEIVRLGRSECVWLFAVTQRGTASMLGRRGGDSKSNIGLYIGVKTQKMADNKYVFPDNREIRLDLLEHPGSFYIKLGKGRILPAKSFFVNDKDDTIRRMAELHTLPLENRIELEPDTVAVLGADYTERWSDARAGAFLDKMRGLRPTIPQQATSPTDQPARTATATQEREDKPRRGLNVRMPPVPERYKEAHRQEKEKQEKEREIAEQAAKTVDELEAFLAAEAAKTTRPEPRPDPAPGPATDGDRQDPRRAKMLEIIRAAGPQGLKRRQMLEGLREPCRELGMSVPAEGVVSRWVKQMVADGLLFSPAYPRYVHADYREEKGAGNE